MTSERDMGAIAVRLDPTRLADSDLLVARAGGARRWRVRDGG